MRVTVLLSLLLVVSTLGALVASASAAAPDGVDSGRVDTFVGDYLDRHGLPGATVAVVNDGEVVHEAGYGTDSAGESLTEHSRMRLASVSKSFTAFAVLRLVDEGKVKLDAPVTRYLPDFGPSDDITVRQLLAHTSGLRNPIIVAPADSLEAGVERTRGWSLESEPGTSYSYSNFNYAVAALVVAEVSGRPFNEYLADQVFAPLGMDDTVAATTTRDPVEGLADGHVTAYGAALPASEPETMVGGAGGVVSTAHDMAAWLATQQRGGVGPDGRALLSPELVEESHTPQPNAQGAGLGWKRSGPGITPERVSHSGVSSGFNAQQDLVPDSGYGVVVLLNSFTPSREHAYEISSGIIDITEGQRPESAPPVATLVDLTLGAVALVALGLGVFGVRRSARWVSRRASWSAWQFVVRLLPQLVAPALVVLVLLVAPTLQNNTYTPADVVRLFPSLAVLLVTLGVVGVGVTAARVTGRLRAAAPSAGQARR